MVAVSTNLTVISSLAKHLVA
ncbi:hypothetical protein SOVF_206430 isoform A, partial [Spinacia oleracea]